MDNTRFLFVDNLLIQDSLSSTKNYNRRMLLDRHHLHTVNTHLGHHLIVEADGEMKKKNPLEFKKRINIKHIPLHRRFHALVYNHPSRKVLYNYEQIAFLISIDHLPHLLIRVYVSNEKIKT